MKVQWNKVTWYSKLIALILFVALPFIGFYLGIQYGKMVQAVGAQATSVTSSATGDNGQATAYYNDPSEWIQDSNNTSGGFTIAYPLDFDAQDNYSPAPSMDWRLNAVTPGIQYFTLTVPSAIEPQTNFVDATLTVGASANDQAVAQCMTPDENDGAATPTSTTAINGIQFTVFKSSGVGAGNYYDTTSYRTLHGGECYAVEYTVHSGAIGNYPSSYNLTPFNEQLIDSLMDHIVGTFTFH